MPGWWRRGNSENCDNLIDLLISEKELRQNHRVQFQFIEMIHPNRLENDSIMAPVAQEAEIIELSLEELEGIQGGRWFKKFFRPFVAVAIVAWSLATGTPPPITIPF